MLVENKSSIITKHTKMFFYFLFFPNSNHFFVSFLMVICQVYYSSNISVSFILEIVFLEFLTISAFQLQHYLSSCFNSDANQFMS